MFATRYSSARLSLQVLLQTYPDSKIAADAKYLMAESYYIEGTPTALEPAIVLYNDFAAMFPTSPLIAQARQRLQEIAEKASTAETINK
jgi:TolA-binding protein